jgi:mannose-6-phosphate isomerase-like protein (cupin superfamily)
MPGATFPRFATGGRWPRLRGVRVENLDRVAAFTTLDGSTIREVAGPPTGNAANQSLAEAMVPPGAATAEHYHGTTEEIYFFTHGSGRMRLGAEERDVGPGDTVVIPPGERHMIRNTGDAPLRLLCACAPAYSDEDTVLTDAP